MDFERISDRKSLFFMLRSMGWKMMLGWSKDTVIFVTIIVPLRLPDPIAVVGLKDARSQKMHEKYCSMQLRLD